ncbi:uncharacterized protein LOC5522077 [Nematostella vectensis]|uniref:uncharacterized protein LOC5522077 n=1 Tax=Nematostella vectensis TaxID=45351 RepID=UPI002077795B|nr:uncharacterized protein LOC5522077 [Nematostella vectensis]
MSSSSKPLLVKDEVASPSGSFKRKHRNLSERSVTFGTYNLDIDSSPFDQSILVRQVKSEDHTGVVELSEATYGDHDSLPLAFHTIMQQERGFLFVALEKRRVVGCVLVNIVDSDQTLAMSGMRIHPLYKRRNISIHLLRGVHNFVYKAYPSVWRERFTACMDSAYAARLRAQHGYRKVTSLKAISVYVSQDVRKLLGLFLASMASDMKETKGIEQLQPEEALRFADQNDLLLFPSNTLVINCVPFVVSSANMQWIFQENDCVLNSTLTDNHPFSSHQAQGKGNLLALKRRLGSEPRLCSFSHGRAVPRVKCTNWEVMLCGNDRDSMRAHLVGQLQHALKITNGLFVLTCFVDESHIDVVHEFLHHYLGLRYVADYYLNELALYERELQWDA